jgi:hypothetical protein
LYAAVVDDLWHFNIASEEREEKPLFFKFLPIMSTRVDCTSVDMGGAVLTWDAAGAVPNLEAAVGLDLQVFAVLETTPWLATWVLSIVDGSEPVEIFVALLVTISAVEKRTRRNCPN